MDVFLIVSRLHFRANIVRCIAAVLMTVVVGCSSSQRLVNPAFPLTVNEAEAALKKMERHPIAPARPIIVLGGYSDPGFGAPQVKAKVQKSLGDGATIIPISFLFCWTFEDCRDRVIQTVDEALPSGDPRWTTEVDVIGISMGGLVARLAAAPDMGGSNSARRLRIARLFTISSPHAGARLAELPTLNSIQLDMREGSGFYRRLRESEAADTERGAADGGGPVYPIIPYARLNDGIVGAEYAAPVGRLPIWMPSRPFEDGHVGAPSDPRILADICRQLRGEGTFAKVPLAPLPTPEEMEAASVSDSAKRAAGILPAEGTSVDPAGE